VHTMMSRLLEYGWCSSLSRHLIGVGVPALVGLVAAGVGDDGAAELPEQLGDGDGDQLEEGGEKFSQGHDLQLP